MSILKKTVFAQNLDKYNAFLTDTEPNSSDSELDNADDVHYGADVRHPKEHNELDNHNDNIDLEKDTENSNNDIDLEEDTESGEESEKKSDDDSEDNINNIDLEEDCDEEYSTKFETSSSKSSHSASKESSYSGDNGSSKQSKEDNTASDASEENCCEKDEGITDKEDQEDDCEEAGKNEIEQDEQKNDLACHQRDPNEESDSNGWSRFHDVFSLPSCV